MVLSLPELYKAHVKNLRSIETGREQVYLQLKQAIAAKRLTTSDALLRVYLLLTGTWAECRLRKLLCEPNGFSDQQRAEILEANSQLSRWQQAIEKGFRKRYGVGKAKLTLKNLKWSAHQRYEALSKLLNDELRPLIEMRNKLAHGQWLRALNHAETDLAVDMIAAINQENALSAHYKGKLITHVADVVHDLVSGGVAFERDFDAHFGLIESTASALKNRKYEDWETLLIAKFDRGKAKRDAP